MPVLMNKGSDPRKAAWLFFSGRSALSEFARAAVAGRFESGVLLVDPDDLESAPKPASEVPVWLVVETLVPEGVDLEAARGEVVERVRRAEESLAADASPDGSPSEPEPENGPADGEPAAPSAAPDAEPSDDRDAPAYEPVPAPEGIRVAIGSTTRLAAQNYLHEQELGGRAWRPELPGLQMLAQLVELMEGKGKGLPESMVWHVDESGIMRMAPAKQVKPMAGNILKVKL